MRSFFAILHFFGLSQRRMESFADPQAAIDEVRPVFPSRRGSEAIPDLPDSFEPGEETSKKGIQRDFPGKNHRPEGVRKIVGSPAELVRIVQGSGEKRRCAAAGTAPVRLEGLMVMYGMDDIRTFAVLKRKGGQEFFHLLGAMLCMCSLAPADIVENSCKVGKEDQPSDAGVGNFTPFFDDDQGAAVDSHLFDMP